MNRKRFTDLYKVFFIAFLVLLSIQQSYADNIILYNLDTDAKSDDEKRTGVLSPSSGLTNFNVDYFVGANANGWDSTVGGFQYWEISPFSTVGLHSVQVNAFMSSDPNGPAHFKLQCKVGSSGSWIDVTNFDLDQTATNKTATLPSTCSNKSEIYVRWIERDYLDYNNNNISNTAYSYISQITVIGTQPITPSSQATNISFVSITQTSITIDCSPGNGDNRIIVINTENSFTNPVNDQIFTTNLNYNGIGQQVIYSGPLSKTTVTVPSSRNPYWVRIYDYNYNEGLTRYITSTNSKNPRLCSLETIDTDPATLIRLTRATIGATISAPQKFTIGSRGFVWGLSPGVGDQDNKITEGLRNTGYFSSNLTNLPRGKRIYFKGWVTNLSGTIYSNESYFDNTPIFTGTGNWEDNTSWNVLEVPGVNGDANYGSASDSPVINGICTLTASNTVTNLTINGGKKLTINKSTGLKVNGTLSNNAGVSGILIKSIDSSTDNSTNGSLIYSSGNPFGTVEMFSIATWNLSNQVNSKYKWQYFGIPVKSLNYNSSFSSCFVREWDESVIDYYGVWAKRNDGTSLQLGSGSVLSSGKGYELVQQNERKYIFSGELENRDINISLPYTSEAWYSGQHILSNPYTSGMPISSINFGSNTEQAIYLYNTGNYNDWYGNGGESTPGNNPGQYTVTTPGTAGSGGIPLQIPSMQGYLVKSTGGTGQISFSKSSLTNNTEKQRVRNFNAISDRVFTRIDVVGKKYSDRMWIFTDESCTRKFDNGWDGKKIIGSNSVTQLYSIEDDANYQINGVNDINNSYIGLQAGDDNDFTFTFTHQNSELKYADIYLVDLVTNKSTNITADGSKYNFTTSASDPLKRFKIVAKPNITTDLDNDTASTLKITYSNAAVFVENFNSIEGECIIYNTSGQVLKKSALSSNGISSISTINFNKGIYIVKALVDKKETTERIIIQ